jgi:hypothetical protein
MREAAYVAWKSAVRIRTGVVRTNHAHDPGTRTLDSTLHKNLAGMARVVRTDHHKLHMISA